jgi:hypothetical protein
MALPMSSLSIPRLLMAINRSGGYGGGKHFLVFSGALLRRVLHECFGGLVEHLEQRMVYLDSPRVAQGVRRGYNVSPSLLSFVREPSVNTIASELRSQDQLKVIMTPPEGHEKFIERAIRPLKEHIWACCERHQCKELPRLVVEGIMFDYITLSNHFPNGSTFPESPKSFVSGERLDFGKWCEFAAGDYGMFWRPYNDKNKSSGRYEHGLILRTRIPSFCTPTPSKTSNYFHPVLN